MDHQKQHWQLVLEGLEKGITPTSEDWNKLAVEEQQLLTELMNPSSAKMASSFINAIDNENEWISLQQRISITEKPNRYSFLKKWMPYAAAVVLVVTVALLTLFNNRVNTTPNAMANNHKRATLTLSDGTLIELNSKPDAVINDNSGVKITNKDTSLLSYISGTEAKIEKYNTLSVPRGGEYSLLLDDGSKIYLNAETKLRFPVSFQGGKSREVFLESGEAYFEVAKNKEKPFIVHTNKTAIRVLGTSFNVNFYNNDVKTTLVEGKVIAGLFGSEDIVLKPNEKAIINSNSGTGNKTIADVEADVAWKDGFIVFSDNDLEQVMTLLGRWYDYDVIFEENDLKKQHFNTRIKKYSSITDVLSIIEQTGKSKFKIENGKIYVMKK